MAQPESRLSRAIMAALRARGIYCVKIHGGPTMAAGTPDILACVPVDMGDPYQQTIGIFVGFETKMPDGGNPTPIQEHQHNKIRVACGQVCIPRSVQDAVRFIESLGFTGPPETSSKPSSGI